MLARSHETLCAHGGGVAVDVTFSHRGSPERLFPKTKTLCERLCFYSKRGVMNALRCITDKGMSYNT